MSQQELFKKKLGEHSLVSDKLLDFPSIVWETTEMNVQVESCVDAQ